MHEWKRKPNSDEWMCTGCDLTLRGIDAAACPGGRKRPKNTAHGPCAQCDPHISGVRLKQAFRP